MRLGKPNPVLKSVTRCEALPVLRLNPLAHAIALLLVASSAQAETAFSAGWFASKGAAQQTAGVGGVAGSLPKPGSPPPLAQQLKANQQLQQSLSNVNNTVAAIAAQQAAQAAGRRSALVAASSIPDGLGEGGLKVDENTLTKGWTNASNPVQTQADGKTTVSIGQTADKAILNWETFNVGRNTTVDFQQQADWAVLNRVNDPQARPSEIQGQIKAAGTVMLVNRNGVIFSGNSQVDTRNLVAAAATISDSQFRERGLYVDSIGSQPTFTDAAGKVQVQQGALIQTRAPGVSTESGGYVLLLGSEVDNAGSLVTPKGQATLAAGDSFYIRKGAGTAGNTTSTTRGNEVASTRKAGSQAGKVSNNGLIQASTGDITLTGHQVQQNGLVLATTSVDSRGTVHLLNSASDSSSSVTLGQGSHTAILLDAASGTALDSQRNAGLAGLGGLGNSIGGAFDNLSSVADRTDQSRVEIVSGGTVDFQSGSITLATGGQVAVSAGQRSLVRDGALIDVAGAVGVKVAMEANSVKVNIQGNEQRDAAGNRDQGSLNNNDVWVDVRELVYVPAGTNGYATDRWYTAGGLLEVGGYLGTQAHGVGEWMAQGGTLTFTGRDVVTQAGSSINLSGGTLDVQGGLVRQTWLKGPDGRLYELSRAPGDILYSGIYKGYEDSSPRWGQTDYYYSPLIAPQQRYEDGYSVGRDAGKLVVGTGSAVLEGQLLGNTYQGERQALAPQAGLDGYDQAQNAVARGAQLLVGSYTPFWHKDSGTLQNILQATDRTLKQVVLAPGQVPQALDIGLDSVLGERQGRLQLDTGLLNGFDLGAVRVAAYESVTVDGDLQVGPAGEIALHGPQVQVNAGLTSHGGRIALGNVLRQRPSSAADLMDTLIGSTASRASLVLSEGARLDTSGLWSNLLLAPQDNSGLAFVNGGSVSLRSRGDLTLAAGSQVDVSSGAVLLLNGSLRGGKGGDLTLAANAGTSIGNGVLTLAGQLKGHGVNGGGTLSLQAGKVQIGGGTSPDAATLVLASDFFDKGFGAYDITGNQGLKVAEGAQVDVRVPVYAQSAGTTRVATGEPAASALQPWLPEPYQEDPAKGRLSQRAGASLTLQTGGLDSTTADIASVALDIGQGATVRVDDGQSIALRGIGQINIDGHLIAHGGKVSISATRMPQVDTDALSTLHQRSILLGSNALVDVSGRAVTALDAQGRRYGKVSDGGSIVIGGTLDPATGRAAAPDLFVQLKAGSRLEASGAQAALDIRGAGSTTVASNGGSISLSSLNGLYLDGDLRAAAGGQGAAGGSLTVALETAAYNRDLLDSDTPLAPRELLISQRRWSLDETAPGTLAYGQGNLSVEQVDAGGFGNLALLSNGQISFDGDVDLALGQGLQLYSASLGLAQGAEADTRVRLSAPYVRLAEAARNNNGSPGLTVPVVRGGSSTQATQAQLTVTSQLLDIRDEVNLGAHGDINLGSGQLPLDQRGFATMEVRSAGDMRMLRPTGNISFTRLNTPGDLNLTVAQLYPETLARAEIRTRHLSIGRSSVKDPGVPYSAYGSLLLSAQSIDQGGVVRAPQGSLRLGFNGGAQDNTSTVRLLPGSLTSLSAAGLVMPFGGTVDGQTWIQDGKPLGESVLNPILGPEWLTLTLLGQSIDVQSGAVVDLSGGGELTGAGFISGRGGSTDARFNPLVRIGADGRFSLPGRASNPVYAIVPGNQAGYAPGAGQSGALDPVIGQQITLEAGVPGLAPGVYTLLPATYALLPGAFRVELNGGAGLAAQQPGLAMANGSWSTSGRLSVLGTGIQDSLSRQVILTSADVLRRYSQYNETSLTQFLVSDAARLGIPRAALTADAKGLTLNLLQNQTGQPSFTYAGTSRFSPDKGGYGTVASVLSQSQSSQMEIVAGGPSAGFTGTSIDAAQLNALGAASLRIGGTGTRQYGQGGNYITFSSNLSDLTLRSGALLSAPEVMLLSGMTTGGIVVEQGAGIDTLGRGASAYDSRDGFIYDPGRTSLLAVSNGWLDLLPPTPAQNGQVGPGSIRIGSCAGSCSGVTQLYSEGTLAAATDNLFELGDEVRYGTRNLTLAVGGVNVGSGQSLAAAAAGHTLAPGLTLNQQVLDRLLRGDRERGAPALETLTLNARDSLNFYGSTQLSTLDPVTGQSSLSHLILGTPAIYGHGDAEDVASIRTANLIWNGTAGLPGTVINQGAGTGSGRLELAAERIEFGYGAQSQPDSLASFDRLALGFATVDLRASQRLTANHKGSLAVYQSQGAYESGKGYSYSGGELNIVTPLLTGEAGSVSRIKAGGDIRISGGGAVPGSINTLGGELALQGRSISLDTAVVLPSGKLSLLAERDLVLAGNARLDLAGRTVPFNDLNKYSWGGDVLLESRGGDIRQAAGARIDLSAQNNKAGALSAIALDPGAGQVELLGAILGGSSGHYDAGGTRVPYKAGGVDIRAQGVGDFAALNQRLNEGQVYGSRSFQLKQGDLQLGNELKAGEINLSLDNGHLTVLGTVDASGEQVGSIRLAARNGLTLGAAALLDAHGTQLRVDSYGKIIDAPNRAVVDLTSGEGRLVLAEGSRIDLRHGTAATLGSQPGQYDGQARGTLELNAPRLGGVSGGDIDIDASSRQQISGARSIAVNGTWRYDDSDSDALLKDGSDAASGRPYRVIDQAYMNRKHDQSTAFIDAALANTALLDGKLAGLTAGGYADALHLRPGVQISSERDVVIQGDLDLSGYRYASLNPHFARTAVYGSGETGSLAIRAAGNLEVRGSVTDGFTPPPATPDDAGWVLLPGMQPFGGELVVPGLGVTLADGSLFLGGKTLNYDLPIKATTFASGVVLPTEGRLAQALTLDAGSVVRGDVRAADGSLLYAAGTLLEQAVTLPVGTRLGAGTLLTTRTALQAMLWPKGVALPATLDPSSGQQDTYALNGDLALKAGALIPSQTDVKLPNGALSVALRPADGESQGRNWAIAGLLPEGSQSWSLRLVSGADTEAADTRSVKPRVVDGQLILADTHYSLFRDREIVPGKPGGNWVWGAEVESPDWSWLGGVVGQPLSPEDLANGYCDWAPGLCEFKPSVDSWVWGPEVESPDWSWLGGVVGQPLSPEDVANGYCDWAPGLCVFKPGEPGEPDKPGEVIAVRAMAPIFSVLRTGTGDLDLVSGGDLSMQSVFGVYTAGTESEAMGAGYAATRGVGSKGSVLGAYDNLDLYRDANYKAGFDEQVAAYEKLVEGDSLYQAWYPEQGGNLLLSTAGSLRGDALGSTFDQGQSTGSSALSSVGIGNWLWRQGSGSAAVDQTVPTAWWINFGTYVTPTIGTPMPQVTGFTGVGTLGGGNLEVRVGADAGTLLRRGDRTTLAAPRSEALILAVGSTGRVGADGGLTLTGGGDLKLNIGGGLNPSLDARASSVRSGPAQGQNHDLNGALINLRGNVQANAGAMGGIKQNFGRFSFNQDAREVRAYDPYSSSVASATGGLVIVPGDATVSLATRGDLVLGGAVDPGRTRQHNTSAFSLDGTTYLGGGSSWFSLWTEHTAIDLFSAGGNLTPSTQTGELAVGSNDTPRSQLNTSPTDGRFIYPSILRAVAPGGNLYYGSSALSTDSGQKNSPYSLVLAPSPNGQLQMLAGGSIFAGGYALNQSGADSRLLPTPFMPAFEGREQGGGERLLVSNLSPDGLSSTQGMGGFPLFAFGGDTLTTFGGRREPARFYAMAGDLVGIRSGEQLNFNASNSRPGRTWYDAAAPVWMLAGRDIVNSGTQLGQATAIVPLLGEGASSGNLFVHNDPLDISLVSAGRDILYSSFNVAGPGLLQINAGRDIRMEDKASITSLGALVPGDNRPGASIVLQAGAGASGPNYTAFAARYLDPANLASDSASLAAQPGKVAKTYETELASWLKLRYGFSGSDEQARAYFASLPAVEQGLFARQVYFAELRAGGLEYNQVDGPRQGSYLRGRNAIAALFPDTDVAGNPIVYQGNITLYGGAGVHTNVGGDIQMLTPGGQQVFGIEGEAPPSTAGVITQGQGNIQLYSQGSILLGQSRIMTTFGGSILGWSAEGDINAGRGSKTTVVYTPPRRVYDNWGNVTLSPSVPSTGAGIATLNPIAEVAPGDIDLIAPLGTIDAGEAGIRVSGNVNIAALQVVNAANIQTQGKSSGIPVVASVNTGALTSASSAASSATQAAEDVARQQQAAARQNMPSVFSVQVLSFGQERLAPTRDGASRANPGYNPDSPVQVLGAGPLSDQARQQLTEEERRQLTL
ncbi:filamentous hemagglutinin family N-terminal domain-containing protein [Pseudomonas sp. NFIX51]|uniref:filamentous hemagglutinin family protein n=1 Tax=unclassified Pseudomonas TaxID=196821 RepID=UPI0008C1A64D|nr:MULTISPECIES: filamentous hemagglutinin family protein [unclassified Pseudomonas]SEK76345.1 filamentous hemagglutinin family N-terminal domain-containing protein [Pseudomonas sp. NFACC41-3]SMH45241.1 filamentous hemagglutinin family N-terminal domain-containing protein [Pseudomonas sp. NFIX51]